MLELLTQDGSRLKADDAQGSGFWLMVMDQYERKGIVCKEAFAKAAKIIISGQHVRNLRALEIFVRDLKNGKTRCKKS